MTVKTNLRTGFDLLPDGLYLATIAVCEEQTAKSGNRKLHIEYEVDGDEHPDHVGRKLFEDRSLVEAAQFRIAQFAQAVDPEAEGDEDGNYEFEPEDTIGTQVAVEVYTDDGATFDNVSRNKVKNVFAASVYTDQSEESED